MFLADHYPPFGCGTSMPAAKDRDGPWGIHPSPIIGSGGCLATARLGVMAPRVDVAHPILDRCLPPLLGRRDVLDQASGAETQFLGHAHRLAGQSAPSLCLCPALLLTGLVRSRHDASLSRSSLLGLSNSLRVSGRLRTDTLLIGSDSFETIHPCPVTVDLPPCH